MAAADRTLLFSPLHLCVNQNRERLNMWSEQVLVSMEQCSIARERGRPGVPSEEAVVPHTLYALDREGRLVHTEERSGGAGDGVATICTAMGGDNQRPVVIYALTLAPHRRAVLPRQNQAATLYILEGTLAVRLGEQTFTVSKDNVVLVGRDSVCTAWNPTSATVRCLVIV